MDQQQREHDTVQRHGKEAALFLLVSAVGIYGLGQGLTGLVVTSQPINLGWLAVAGIAFYVLSAQMSRVHDTWPHRPADSRSTRTQTQVRQAPPVPPESR
jgi:hypothetical protein